MDILFGIHCHQPVNNFHQVVKEATEKSYFPFLNILKDFKNIRINVHISGWLFQWFKDYHNPTFNLLKKLSDNNQIEFFSAGFYEPILTVIPEKDAEIQIKKLNKFIKDNFGQSPQGLWLTERVWEDKLIKLLVNCNIKYVVVDDYHFFASGFTENSLKGYYLTEDSGNELAIFPISQKLRYLIPFKSIDEIENFLRTLDFGVIFDDGEKFGLWPKTYQWVYEKNWLKDFFHLLDSGDFINSLTFQDYFHNNKPTGRVYLPEVSYYEMGEWSLDSSFIEELEKFKKNFNLSENENKYLRGGIWKNFLIKYEEANNIHKKIIYISNKIKNKNLKDKAYNLLLQAQCNDCLWHGIFGGIYLPNLRDNAYLALNAAENLLKNNKSESELLDVNKDGYEELILKNSKITASVSSKFSGALFEFSDRNSCFNILNTLTRRREFYHNNILKPKSNKENSNKIATIHEIDFEVTEEIKKDLIFDKFLKYSFVDIFSSNDITFNDYKNNKFSIISDFHNKPYKFFSNNTLFCNGNIKLFNYNFPVKIEKAYYLNNSSLNVSITAKNLSFLYFDIFYIVELNFFFPGHSKKQSYIKFANNKFKVETEIEIENLNEFSVYDDVIENSLKIEADKKFKLFSYPFYSVSKSEKAYDKIYQGSTFALIFPFDYKKNEERNYKINVEFEY